MRRIPSAALASFRGANLHSPYKPRRGGSYGLRFPFPAYPIGHLFQIKQLSVRQSQIFKARIHGDGQEFPDVTVVTAPQGGRSGIH